MTKLLVMLNSVHDTKLNSHRPVVLHDSNNQHLPKKIAKMLISFSPWKPAFMTLTFLGRSVVQHCIYCIQSKRQRWLIIRSKGKSYYNASQSSSSLHSNPFTISYQRFHPNNFHHPSQDFLQTFPNPPTLFHAPLTFAVQHTSSKEKHHIQPQREVGTFNESQ